MDNPKSYGRRLNELAFSPGSAHIGLWIYVYELFGFVLGFRQGRRARALKEGHADGSLDVKKLLSGPPCSNSNLRSVKGWLHAIILLTSCILPAKTESVIRRQSAFEEEREQREQGETMKALKAGVICLLALLLLTGMTVHPGKKVLRPDMFHASNSPIESLKSDPEVWQGLQTIVQYYEEHKEKMNYPDGAERLVITYGPLNSTDLEVEIAKRISGDAKGGDVKIKFARCTSAAEVDAEVHWKSFLNHIGDVAEDFRFKVGNADGDFETFGHFAAGVVLKPDLSLGDEQWAELAEIYTVLSESDAQQPFHSCVMDWVHNPKSAIGFRLPLGLGEGCEGQIKLARSIGSNLNYWHYVNYCDREEQ